MCWRTEKCARSNAKKKRKKVKEEVRVSITFHSTLLPAALRSQRRENNTHTHTRRKNREFAAAWSTIKPPHARMQSHMNTKNAPNPLTFKNAGNSSNLSFIVLIGFVRSPSYKQRKFPPSSSPPCAVGFVDGMMYFLSHSK